jgi:uncharacterized membrane protein YbhN (UPF0104 family)
VTVAAFAIAGGTVTAIAAAYGFKAFAHAWAHPHYGWIGLAIVAQLLAVAAYALSYRVLAQFDGGPRLRLPVLLRLVIAGFGPSAVGGGFALDKHALHAIERDEERAATRVLALGALEWALLAPAAWISAVVLLAVEKSGPMPSLTWAWAIAVPVGFALGLWFASGKRSERLASDGAGRRAALKRALDGVGVLFSLAGEFSRYWTAWLGTGLYWALDIASFYACVRFVGLRPGAAGTVLAYATGYALTRRSIPLGGAGVVEASMTFALHWVGQPVAPALAVVVLYRLLNFVLPALPALLARPRTYPLLVAVGAAHPASDERPGERRSPAARQLAHE